MTIIREYAPFEVSKEETKKYWRRVQNKWIMTIIMIKVNLGKKNKKSLVKKWSN